MVLSGANESISSIIKKQVSQGISYALSAISFNILSESPTIPLLKSPAAFNIIDYFILSWLTIGYVANVTPKNSQILRDIADLPVPGGPQNKIPLGDEKHSVVNCIISLPNLSSKLSIAMKWF